MTAGRWLLRPPPDTAERLLLGFPYAGGGASLYRAWPTMVGGAWFGALEPPGREFRTGEKPARTHEEFTASLVPFLAAYAHRPIAFFGHCGGVPLALSTALAMVDAGLPAPFRIFASGWGPPHLALYGPLNHVDLATVDLRDDVRRMFGAFGVPARDDIVEIAAASMRVDLELHRPHLYAPSRRVPAPVTVIGWSRDDVVPAEQSVGREWLECADADFHVLEGEHFMFARCPESMRQLMADRLMGPPRT